MMRAGFDILHALHWVNQRFTFSVFMASSNSQRQAYPLVHSLCLCANQGKFDTADKWVDNYSFSCKYLLAGHFALLVFFDGLKEHN